MLRVVRVEYACNAIQEHTVERMFALHAGVCTVFAWCTTPGWLRAFVRTMYAYSCLRAHVCVFISACSYVYACGIMLRSCYILHWSS